MGNLPKWLTKLRLRFTTTNNINRPFGKKAGIKKGRIAAFCIGHYYLALSTMYLTAPLISSSLQSAQVPLGGIELKPLIACS